MTFSIDGLKLPPDDDVPQSEILLMELRRFEKHQLEIKEEYGAKLLHNAIERILYLEQYFIDCLDGNLALMKLFEATRKEIEEQWYSRATTSAVPIPIL